MSLLIFEKAFSRENLGALFLLMRRKTTTKDEIKGFLDAWEQAYPSPFKPFNTRSLLVSSPFDGKKRSVYLSPLVAGLLQEAGIPVVVGGARGIGPKYGLTERDLFSSENPFLQNIPLSLENYPVLWDACELYSFYEELISSRNEVGLRSFLHTIEKLLNPYGATHAILTLHHEPYVGRYFYAMEGRIENVTLVFGEEGTSDICWKRPTRYIRKIGQKKVEGFIDPKEWGLPKLDTHRPGGLKETSLFWEKALKDKGSSENIWVQAQQSFFKFALGEGDSPFDIFQKENS
ncbi:hypothetical protein AB834_06835 [PVC group bacterium (ex Bugula neritina AB1)]|nr:hypothetical protein AB834_06835 [PVC group bacterium (ex Bugula neritina AB1)]